MGKALAVSYKGEVVVFEPAIRFYLLRDVGSHTSHWLWGIRKYHTIVSSDDFFKGHAALKMPECVMTGVALRINCVFFTPKKYVWWEKVLNGLQKRLRWWWRLKYILYLKMGKIEEGESIL